MIAMAQTVAYSDAGGGRAITEHLDKGVDIYLTDLETGDRMRFPLLPEKINIQAGGIFQSYTVLMTGNIELPTGEELTGFHWKGILPGEARKYDPFISEWQNPQEIQVQWGIFKQKRKKLRLLITETPINYDVYLQRYTVEYSGGYGDYTYNIWFVQAKDLLINVSNISSPIIRPTAAQSQGEQRPSPPEPTTVTVRQGDSFWSLAQKYLGDGSRYEELYALNSDVTDNDPRNEGNRYSIFPGQVLTIPR
jgi:hypothetical protein